MAPDSTPSGPCLGSAAKPKAPPTGSFMTGSGSILLLIVMGDNRISMRSSRVAGGQLGIYSKQ